MFTYAIQMKMVGFAMLRPPHCLHTTPPNRKGQPIKVVPYVNANRVGLLALIAMLHPTRSAQALWGQHPEAP